MERPVGARLADGVQQSHADWSWLPKVEVNCRLDGAMRSQTLMELAIDNQVDLPLVPIDELFRCDEPADLSRALALVQSVLRTPDDWERLAFESVYDGARVGLRYREAFFSPTRPLAAGQDLVEIVAALDRGFSVGERVTGARCSLVFEIDPGAGPAVADAHVERLVELKRSGRPGFDRVIGLGMGSTAPGVDALAFSAAYARAARAGLRRSVHQGDDATPCSIVAALDVLGCDRIDEGHAVLQDPELVARFDDQQIPITDCPTASMRSGSGAARDLSDHVFATMRDADLLATLNTGVPGIVDLDLDQEYAFCADAFDLDVGDMVEIALDGVRSSWLDDGDITVLMGEINAAAAKHRRALHA